MTYESTCTHSLRLQTRLDRWKSVQVVRCTSLVFLFLVVSTTVALANPFLVARFDGIEGGILNTGAYSSYWNPAGMVRAGSRFQLHTMTVYRRATFDRFIEENDIPPDLANVNGGKNQTGRVGAVPGIAATHTFHGGDFSLAVGGGFFIDRAGTMKWDTRPDADPAYPGAVDGPQRWAGISTRFAILSPGFGIGIGHKKSKVSAGATLLVNFADLSTVRAQNVGRTDAVVDDRGQLAEGRILLKNASDIQPAMILGLRWEASDRLTLAATWHQMVTYQLEGEVFITFGLADETSARSVLELPVPQTARLGAEFKASPDLTLRHEVEFSQWSVLQRQRSVNLANGELLLDVAREFDDTYKNRLSALWRLDQSKTLLGLISYESGATPTRTHEPGLAESNNFEFGLGGTWTLSPRWVLKSSFVWQEFDDVTVTDSVQRPPQNGEYTDRRLFLTTDMEVRW